MSRFSLFFLPAIAYQCLAIAAAVRHLWRRNTGRRQLPTGFCPPVSVLKPLRGLDPNIYQTFVTQAHQNYPRYELLFGVRDENDPAAAQVRRLQREYPGVSIRLIVSTATAPNGKVGILMELARHAQHPVWVVNDSDIKVTPEYLKEIVAPLANPAVGLVTCLYRPRPHSIPAIWETLGIATDFMPSALVAPLLGVREFGLGSTLAFFSRDLERAGGFESLADYLADDYQLAKRITALGKQVVLSTYIVETSLGDSKWRGVWQHQLRWARTIRLSKGRGYAGLPIAQAGIWMLIAAFFGVWPAVLALGATRVLSALVIGGLILVSPVAVALSWLAPVWDLFAFALWLSSYTGRNVHWRDRKLIIDSQGRIRT